jgi:hypothetical protein
MQIENLEPLQRLLMHKFSHKIDQKDKSKEELRKAMKKRHKSLSLDRNLQSPEKRSRKYTHDQINPKKSFS